MYKGKILNKKLLTAIADMGHGDIMIISDAGFPIPTEEQRVDLAIEPDQPNILRIFELIADAFIYEQAIVADEQRLYNPKLFEGVCALCKRCEVETIPHEQLIAEMPRQAKYIVRTGGFEPWGNIILYSGVDAPEWFKKEGVMVPGYYQQRVNYKE